MEMQVHDVQGTFTCALGQTLQFSFSGLISNRAPRPARHSALSTILTYKQQAKLDPL